MTCHLPEDEIIGDFLFPDHLLAQNTNIGSDPDGDFEDDIIESFLESNDKESVPFELTNIPPEKTQESLDHFSGDKFIEDYNIYDFLESHNINDESDKVEGVEDVVIDEFLDLIGDA